MRRTFRRLFALGIGILTVFLAHTPQATTLVLHGVRTEVYFSPKGGAEEAVVRTIAQAKRTIHVLAYSFTSSPINTALVQAHARGVNVSVILDKSQRTAKGGKLQSLQEAGIPVLMDSAHAIAHNKVMVIDTRRVITGSFNFTRSAEERNAENLLIIHSRSLSRTYLNNFEIHAQHSQLPLK